MLYKKIILLTSVIAGLFILGWFGARSLRKGWPHSNVIKTPEAALKDEQTAMQETIQKMQQTDSDLDGLSDANETKYGTDQTKADTDGDGLNDKDEIFIYKTSPLTADTYNLGHNDNWGVAHGVILFAGKVDKSKLK